MHDSTSALSLVYLNLLDAVDNEHVLQVLHGSVHPVVEGSSPLGKLQIQLIDGLPQLLHTLPEQKAFTLYGHIIIIIYIFFPHLTSRASLLFWVRVPRLSHWSQMPWQRELTEAASW